MRSPTPEGMMKAWLLSGTEIAEAKKGCSPKLASRVGTVVRRGRSTQVVQTSRCSSLVLPLLPICRCCWLVVR